MSSYGAFFRLIYFLFLQGIYALARKANPQAYIIATTIPSSAHYSTTHATRRQVLKTFHHMLQSRLPDSLSRSRHSYQSLLQILNEMIRKLEAMPCEADAILWPLCPIGVLDLHALVPFDSNGTRWSPTSTDGIPRCESRADLCYSHVSQCFPSASMWHEDGLHFSPRGYDLNPHPTSVL